MDAIDIVKDLHVLTSIPEFVLNKLVSSMCDISCHAVLERNLNHEIITDIDLGLGLLSISNSGDELTYHFSPSKHFEEQLVDTLTNNKSPLIDKAEKSLEKKVMDVYKDLF